MISKLIESLDLAVHRSVTVHGGDINNAYLLYADNKNYFLKTNNALEYPFMLEKEARGLNALKKYSAFKVPEVLGYGTFGDEQYLLLEYMEEIPPGSSDWENFGVLLAEMHKISQPYFGWNENNFIGSLVQVNTKKSTWQEFYGECRLMPLAIRMNENGNLTVTDIRYIEKIIARIADIFPAEPPSFLHGDLWSGNYMITAKGPAIIDPAVYFGHREIDMAMTRLFGGFPSKFYVGYIENYPLEKDWEKRLEITQLYPLMVHAVLFGNSYVERVRRIIRNWGQ